MNRTVIAGYVRTPFAQRGRMISPPSHLPNWSDAAESIRT